MKYITIILVLTIFILAFVGAISMLFHEKNENTMLKETIKKNKELDKNKMEKYKDAEQKKKAADTGNIQHDLDVMANELRN